MVEHSNRDPIAAEFRHLRHTDANAVPAFRVDRKPAADFPRWPRRAPLALAAAAVVVVLGSVTVLRTAPEGVDTVPPAAWDMPTDFLLDTPWYDLAGTVPDFQLDIPSYDIPEVTPDES
jgi:hypothetical protein